MNDFHTAKPKAKHITLPEQPIAVIVPKGRWAAINFKELWIYRDFLYVLIERDLRVRYKQTVLGAAWAVIQPLLTMVIFTVFFGRVAGVDSDGTPYPIFAYAGLLPWTFFSNAVLNSSNSLVASSNLITKVYFPRLIVPFATVIAGFFDFIIAFPFLVLMMFYYKVEVTVNLLMLPVLTFLIMLLAMGLGTWAAGLNVKYRDVRYALPFVIQIGLFITPIIYPLSIVPQKWHWVMALNPLTGLIESFRRACFGQPLDWTNLGISTAVTLAVFIGSAFIFRSMEKSFADVV